MGFYILLNQWYLHQNCLLLKLLPSFLHWNLLLCPLIPTAIVTAPCCLTTSILSLTEFCTLSYSSSHLQISFLIFSYSGPIPYIVNILINAHLNLSKHSTYALPSLPHLKEREPSTRTHMIYIFKDEAINRISRVLWDYFDEQNYMCWIHIIYWGSIWIYTAFQYFEHNNGLMEWVNQFLSGLQIKGPALSKFANWLANSWNFIKVMLPKSFGILVLWI